MVLKCQNSDRLTSLNPVCMGFLDCFGNPIPHKAAFVYSLNLSRSRLRGLISDIICQTGLLTRLIESGRVFEQFVAIFLHCSTIFLIFLFLNSFANSFIVRNFFQHLVQYVGRRFLAEITVNLAFQRYTNEFYKTHLFCMFCVFHQFFLFFKFSKSTFQTKLSSLSS